MGLFIGASTLTILELFDYIYEVRLGIIHGERTICRSLILRHCPGSKPGGEDSLCPPEPAFSSLSMNIVSHHVLGMGEGWVQGGRSHSPTGEKQWAVYASREGGEGMRRRGDWSEASSEPLPWRGQMWRFIHGCVRTHTFMPCAHTHTAHTYTILTHTTHKCTHHMHTHISHRHTCPLGGRAPEWYLRVQAH